MEDTSSVPIQCPACGTRFSAPVTSIIDVGMNPALRQQFLSGQLNLAVCPNCGSGGLLEVPLVYHDPAADFLAVYFPPQMSIPELQKQKMIGELTQALMRSVPTEQRKGYFLNPRQFVSRQSLMDAVLGTMGISQEELDRQRKKAKLVEQFAVMADDPKGLQLLVKSNDSQLDGEFFAILSSMLEQARAARDEKSAARFQLLRESLMPLTTYGKRAAKQRAAIESLKDLKGPDEFLRRVVDADPDEVLAIALAARPLMDYRFFEGLTSRLEASQGADRERLTKLRDHLLETTQHLDQAARQGLEEAASTLRQILESSSPRSAVHERAEQIDDVFMSVLMMNIREAERNGNRQLQERLMMVYDEVMSLVEASLPPEMQLINELLEAHYPEGTRALLREKNAEITPEVIDLMASMAADMASRDDPGASETAKRLRDIRAQAMLMV